MTPTALITGATGGIGLAYANLLARQQTNLILVGRNATKLQDRAKELQERTNVTITSIQADLSESSAPRHVYDTVVGKNLSVDYLINNAGFGGYGAFTQTDWQMEHQMIQVNIMALTELTKLFLPSMVSRGSGKILNMASTAAFVPGPLMSVYYATKAYVLSFSEAIGYELRNTGVTVTAVCPGPTRSGFQKASNIEESGLVKDKKLPTAEEVAVYGLEEMMKGTPVAVHTIKDRIQTRIIPLLPRSYVLSTVYNLQKKQ